MAVSSYHRSTKKGIWKTFGKYIDHKPSYKKTHMHFQRKSLYIYIKPVVNRRTNTVKQIPDCAATQLSPSACGKHSGVGLQGETEFGIRGRLQRTPVVVVVVVFSSVSV